jgi:protein-S-isoprenylcysteine O-methyltransferase Ste14
MSTKEYEINTKSDHPQLVVNPFIIYIGIGLTAVLLQSVLPLPFFPATASKIIGVTMLIINMLIGIPAVLGMLKANTSPNPGKSSTTLIFSGPYRFSRNPMYIGLTLIYTGILSGFQITWGIVFLPLVIWLISVWVIRPEEKYLSAKFGDPYQQYTKTVRRWI